MGNDRPANATDSLPPQNNRLSLASYCCTRNRNIWVNGNVAHCLGSIPGIRVWFMLKAKAEEAKEIFTMHAFRLMPRLSTPTLSSTKATEWPWPILQLSNINQKRSWRTSRKSVSSVLISTVWKCVEMCGKGWSSEWAPSLLLAWPSAASLPRQKSKAGESAKTRAAPCCKNWRALARPYNDTLALGRLGNLAAWE